MHEDLKMIASGVPGVIETEKCIVRKMGFDYYVDMHIIVDGNLTVRRGHLIGHKVKDAIQSAYPRVADVMVHVEPHDRE
jgi:divalent metal cation (Fe/Co/Zn/Cd) transporter